MKPWIVFSSEDDPKRMLDVLYVVADNPKLRMAEGELLVEAKSNLAQQIARKIIESPEFFRMRRIPTEGFTEISASVVCLTVDEWRQAMEYQFKKGMRCGAGFSPERDTWL